MLHYQSRAIGTREEIIKALRSRASANGSSRREAEAEQAIYELDTGATVVRTRSFEFVVTGEPVEYVVELNDGTFRKVTARSHTEAWQLAHKLPNRVIRLYRDVTRDET